MREQSDWKRVTLDQVAESYPNSLVDGPFGSDLKTTEYSKEGVRLIQLQNIGDGYWVDDNQKFIPLSKFSELSRHATYPGDIAIAKMADPVARACIIPGIAEKLLVVADCIRLAVNHARYDPHYIVYAINHRDFRRQAEYSSTGTTRQRINLSTLKKLTLYVPSLSEQHRIANILDIIDEQIQHTEQLIAKLKNQRAGLLYKLLTCGIDKHSRLRASSDHDGTSLELDIKKFPKEWKLRPLGTIAEVGSGLTLNKRLNNTDAITLPYLRVANVQDGYLDLSEIKTVSVAKDDVSKYLLQPNDVLMIEGGDFDKLGRGTIWKGQISPCLHQNHIFRVRPDIRYLLPEFLTLLSGSSYGKRFFMLSSKQSTNLASINSTQLKSFPIPCPSIAEQEHILRMISEYDEDMSIEEMELEKLKRYKIGLMHDLLTGNVHLVNVPEEAEH